MKTKQTAFGIRTALPIPTWPPNVANPVRPRSIDRFHSADKVRRLLGMIWDEMATLHDSGKLPLERRHGHLVIHEDDALRYCSPEELSGDTTELWDDVQVKGGGL